MTTVDDDQGATDDARPGADVRRTGSPVDETTVDEVPETANEGGDPTPAADPRRAGRGVRGELLLTLELAGLCAFAFSRPVLDSFGRSPESFVARGAGPGTVVQFGLVVVLLPLAIVALAGLVARAFGATVRWWVHLVLLAAIGWLAAWRLTRDVTGYAAASLRVLVAATVLAAALVVLRWRAPGVTSFLRYAGVASVLFLGQFLFTSPASSLVHGDQPGLDPEVTRAVAGALGDDAPPIVVIVADMFPTQVLVDGTGQIDAELYPNIAELASTSTWYRNNTTLSPYTTEAVPALLSGHYPSDSDRSQMLVADDETLFTLLGGSYDLHVREPITRLCPRELCPQESAGVGALVGDAVDLWRGSVATEPSDGLAFDLPGVLGADRYGDMEAWIDEQDFSPGGRPDLFVYHVLLPHDPWTYLPDGSVYEGSDPPHGMFIPGWTHNGAEGGQQRLALQTQALDGLLGRMFDRMRDAGTYDDAVIVLAGDHGASFTPLEPWRGVSAGNYTEVLWSTLLIKGPGQTTGTVSDDNVQTIDVVPTMAHLLGIEIPWEVDGIVAGVEQRDPDVKFVDDIDGNPLRSTDGAPRVEVDAGPGLDAVLGADLIPGTGADAVWKRTVHGDLLDRAVSGLDVAEPGDGTVALTGLDELEDVDVDDPLPIEVAGTTDLPPGTVLAFALNGRIAGLTTVGTEHGVGQFVQALLLPRLFEDGANELDAYVVDGDVGAEVLHPVELEAPG